MACWWKECVVYQIYPRSFLDTNGDGIGDIEGIIRKLDYIASLGVGAIWLNPIYDSPNDDMGYDIRNYEALLKEYGTMADFDRLLKEAHARNIRIIMDLVVNHSSDEHAWFVHSRSSKDDPYRDYYIWRDGKDGKEPNNWASFFTPSAWKYDDATKQWYLHLFSEKQPDLNWENPKVRDEVFSMMNRWFDKGVDAFRMDVINLIGKRSGLPDGTGAPGVGGYVFSPEHFANQPAMFEYLDEMKRRCFDGRDCMCVGEVPFADTELGARLTAPNLIDMIFQFELMDIDSGKSGKWEIIPWKLEKFKRIIREWQAALDWNSLFWSNHDQPRPVSRFGCTNSEQLRVRSAKLLAVAMHLLRGTSFIYQGEELGMTNMPFSDASELRDIESLQLLENAADKQAAWQTVLKKGRDNARTPMQWNAQANGGFTDGTPWLGVNPNYNFINVEAAESDPDSVLHFYRRLIKLKLSTPALVYGDYRERLNEHEQIFAYERTLDGERILVICNMSGQPVKLRLPEAAPNGKVLLSNVSSMESNSLLPYEARVLSLK